MVGRIEGESCIVEVVGGKWLGEIRIRIRNADDNCD